MIAYLLPGFVSLWGISLHSPIVRVWLSSPSGDTPSLGGFLYVTVASLAAGLILSTIRWLILDSIHAKTGVLPPKRDFSRLEERGGAFSMLVSDLYRYYQFYGNTMVAAALSYGIWRFSAAASAASLGTDIGFVLLEALLYAGSRDTLRKYYERSAQVLRPRR